MGYTKEDLENYSEEELKYIEGFQKMFGEKELSEEDKLKLKEGYTLHKKAHTPWKRSDAYNFSSGEHKLQQTGRKIGRNEPCMCGSGKKVKHCCGIVTQYFI